MGIAIVLSLTIMGGLVLLVVPGIILGVSLSLSLFAFVTEDARGMEALLKSREYVKGYWGQVAWRIFFIAALTWIIGFVLASSAVVFTALSKTPLVITGGVVGFLKAIVITPIWAAYMFLVYQHLRALKGAVTPDTKARKKFSALGILGILGVVGIILILFVRASNPSQLLGMARDSTRVNNITTLKSLITLYLADVSNPSLCPEKGKIFSSLEGSTAIDGTGWLPINFTAIRGGSPLSELPLDPLQMIKMKNSSGYYYSYACDPQSQTFELNARMEDERFNKGGARDVVSTDLGDNPNIYEVGTDLKLLY
ncbi:MAG: hypothetical protein FJY98_04115 [Candidatus Liptonbacteria bacterium]|nr:hypothetical protein [Candidatus Liptonbacteria bacterium]